MISSTTSSSTKPVAAPPTPAVPKAFYTAADYFSKITKPEQCYGTNLDVYESFNMTDMGYENPSEGTKHPGWVICNQSTKTTNAANDLSEIYLCNNNRPDSWFIYPDAPMLYEEDRYLRYLYTPPTPFFLTADDMA